MMMMEPSENYEYILYLVLLILPSPDHQLELYQHSVNFVGKSVKLGLPNIALCCIIMDQSVNLFIFW